jgi:hypothetical protein
MAWPGDPGSGSAASGLQLVFDRDRAADLPKDSPVLWVTAPALGALDSPERERGLVLTPGRGTSLHSLQARKPFTLVRVINRVGGHCLDRLYGADDDEESLGVVGPEVFDSQKAGGYSPLDFPLLGDLCWAS